MTDQPATQGERVQKVLAQMGIGSRREMERAIEQGKISINVALSLMAAEYYYPSAKINVFEYCYITSLRVRFVLAPTPKGGVQCLKVYPNLPASAG